MTSALVFIADGTEEIEFTITYDTLVRAGVKCLSVFVPAAGGDKGVGMTDPDQKTATCSRGVVIIANSTLKEVIATNAIQNTDLLVVPGGVKGAETISSNSQIQDLIRHQLLVRDKWVGMICAGSLAAKTSGLPSRPITSHPSVKGELDKDFEYREDAVVVSGKLVTTRGPGTTFPFALKLVEFILGADVRKRVQDPMVFPDSSESYLL